jgi:DNA-binding response OmpR family regulator
LPNSGTRSSKPKTESALQVLAEASRTVDVILLDYRLPDSNNLELLSTIRRMTPSSHIIMMTAQGTPDLNKGALDRGANGVMNKPFEMGEIAAVVRHAHQGQPQ